MGLREWFRGSIPKSLAREAGNIRQDDNAADEAGDVEGDGADDFQDGQCAGGSEKFVGCQFGGIGEEAQLEDGQDDERHRDQAEARHEKTHGVEEMKNAGDEQWDGDSGRGIWLRLEIIERATAERVHGPGHGPGRDGGDRKPVRRAGCPGHGVGAERAGGQERGEFDFGVGPELPAKVVNGPDAIAGAGWRSGASETGR